MGELAIRSSTVAELLLLIATNSNKQQQAATHSNR
jgi:predicted XRE-type DNA-binding protein